MKKLLVALFLFLPTIAFAQSAQRNPCLYNLNGGCQSVGTSSTIDDPITGSIAATNGTLTIPTNGRSTIGVSVTGTWSGALTVRVSVDYGSVGAANATWGTTTAISLASGSIITGITADGIYQVNASGFSAVQIIGTSIVSGTANIALLSSVGVSTVMADNPFPVIITQQIGITPTDHTITSASGSSQTLMAANVNRHSMTIVNTGNANCGVNPTGGTAAIGGAGTLTLSALGAYTPRVPTLSAVTVICTAGQPIYADDN